MVLEKKVLTRFSLMNDAAFKALFRSQEARGIVATFLSEVTGISKERFLKAKFVGGELPKQIISEKGKTADVLIHLNSRQFVILEANTTSTNTLFEKNLSYATSVYTEAIRVSETEYPRVILVNINQFNRHHTKDAIIEYQLQDKKDHYYLKNSFVIYDIILENLIDSSYTNIVLKKFGKFLTASSLEELESILEGDREYMEAYEKVEDLSRDEEFIGYYDYEEAKRREYACLSREMKEKGLEEGLEKGRAEGHEEGLALGIKEGKKEGKKEAQKEFICKMYKNGMGILDISNLLELKEEEIQKILFN